MAITNDQPKATEPTTVANIVVPVIESVAETELSRQEVRPSTVKLSVPLDAPTAARSVPHRTIIRRDSLERREALLKGKEGSRQRRRWENGMLNVKSK